MKNTTQAEGTVITYGKGRHKCKVAVYPDDVFVQLIDGAALIALADGVAVTFPDLGGIWINEKHIPDVLPSVAKEWPQLRAKIVADVRKAEAQLKSRSTHGQKVHNQE